MIEYLATVLSLVGAVCNILKRKESFIIWFVANIIWIYVMAERGIWGMVICQVVFCITCVIGYIKWSKDEY